MGNVNGITICRENYETQEGFENVIKNTIMALLENDYIMTVKYDSKEFGIVWIQYDYNDFEMCEYYPSWVPTEESEEYKKYEKYYSFTRRD